jgi:hypothetical protein
LSRRHRAVITQTLEQSRRFVRRIVDRDARDRGASDRWDNEGGASEATIDATVR